MKRARYWIAKSRIEYRKLSAVLRKDRYDRMAAELADQLLGSWDGVTNDVLQNIIASIRGGTPFTQSDLGDLVGRMRPYFSDRFTREVSQPMYELHSGIYARGIADITRQTPLFNVADERAINILHDHNVYWVKNYFDDHLRGQVVSFGEQIIGRGLNRKEAGQMFAREFADKYEAHSWRYWEGFANHVTTRSRAMGAVSGYQRAEIEYVEVRAVIDHRTTEICNHMHGRRIAVGKLVEMKNKLLDAESPDQVKDVAPWPNLDDVAGVSTDQLPESASMPPYHFNCRTRIVAAPSDISHTDISGIESSSDQQLANRVTSAASNQEQMSRQEVARIIDRVNTAGWGSHKIGGKTTSRYHFEKHAGGRDIGASSLADYNQKMMALVNDPARSIYLQKHNNRHPQVVFRKGNATAIYDVSSGNMKTFLSMNDRKFAKAMDKFVNLKLTNTRGIAKWLQALKKRIIP